MNLNEAIALIEPFGPNCLLGVCCPPKAQRDLLALALATTEKQGGAGMLSEEADLAAGWILGHFDLAPKDSVTPLLRKAGELAKSSP